MANRSNLRSLLVLALLVGSALGIGTLSRGRQADQDAQVLRAQARPGDIVMLSSLSCGYCERARVWLETHEVPHAECFIERNSACLAEFQARGARGTPTFVVRGQTIVGFDRARILAALKRPAAAPG